MCHASPPATLFSSSMCTFALLVVLFHIFKYDRGLCMIQVKGDPFRWTIMWFFVLALALLTVWAYTETYVKYFEYYLYIPRIGVLPKPWKLWSNANYQLYRNSYIVLALGWTLLMGVHLEEVMFWSYLINTIKGKRSQLWTQSIYFKMWVAGMIASVAVLFSAVGIDTTDLAKLETHIFFAGSILSMIAVIMSLYVLFVFPSFIRESRRQGANTDLIEKLEYFAHCNRMRTLFRFIYSACFLTLAIDGLTSVEIINHSALWMDLLLCSAMLSVFLATVLSILILLPRNMRGEAGMISQNQVFVQHAFPTSQKRASRGHSKAPKDSFGASSTGGAWLILGDRLHLEQDDVQDLVAAQQDRSSTFELPFTTKMGGSVHAGSGEDLVRHHMHGYDESVSSRSLPSMNKEQRSPSDFHIVVTAAHDAKV